MPAEDPFLSPQLQAGSVWQDDAWIGEPAGRQGKELGSNKFDYYDDVKNGMYGDVETWDRERFRKWILWPIGKMINPAKALKDNVEEGECKPSMISSAYGDGYSVAAAFPQVSASCMAEFRIYTIIVRATLI